MSAPESAPRGRGAAGALDAGDLPLGPALLALLRPALAGLAPGGILAIRARDRSLRQDLPSFCRAERHEWLGVEEETDGADRHLLARGAERAPARDDLAPASADPSTGFAPLGAAVEAGSPSYPFSLVDRARAAPPEAADLYRQAVEGAWSADRDLSWDRARPLPPERERALGQVFTFLAENELAALYVPARFLPAVHPYYVETAQFLASQISDEARHVDVFLRRARLHGRLGAATAATSRSLLSLLETQDFLEATFLLSVLGEGTFLDLLRYLERHAPDSCTEDLLRRARADETRHVHFGIAHVRHALAADPTLGARLEGAVRRRAATLAGIGSLPAAVQDALVLWAAGGTAASALRRGEESFVALLAEMHEGRMRRLRTAGFDAEGAERVSALHTPNFM